MRPTAPRSSSQAALGGVRADLLASGVAQVPQVAFQVDEGHRGPLASGSTAGHGPAEIVDQLADRLFSQLVAGCAAAGGYELAEQPQQQERLVRRTLLVDRCLPEASQLCQQLVAGQALAFTRSANIVQVAAGKASWGPSGSLLSRTVTDGPVVPTSTQVPPLLPL
jgi:hypothetical protein